MHAMTQVLVLWPSLAVVACSLEKMKLSRKNRQSDGPNAKFEIQFFAPSFNLEKRNQILSDHWGNVESEDAPA